MLSFYKEWRKLKVDRWLLILAIFIGIIFFDTYAYAGIGLSPLLQELSVAVGEEQVFYLNLFYSVRKPTAEKIGVRLSVMDFSVARNGALSFIEADTTKWSCASWIQINPTALVLNPGEHKKIECRISVPRYVRGERYAAIIADIGSPTAVRGSGVAIQFRIASGVFLTIPGRIFRKKARISELKVQLLGPYHQANTRQEQPLITVGKAEKEFKSKHLLR